MITNLDNFYLSLSVKQQLSTLDKILFIQDSKYNEIVIKN